MYFANDFENIHKHDKDKEEMKETEDKVENTKQHPAVGFVSKPFEFTYNFKDVIIYNLGVGASLKNADGLQHLYEGHDKFAPIPSFAVIPGFAGNNIKIF